jgi:hypothetical protein
MKKFLLFAGTAVVLGVIGFTVWIFLTKDKMMAQSFEMIKSAVVRDLPMEAEEDSVVSRFDKAIARIRSGQANEARIQDFLMTFRSCAKDKQLDSLEVTRLLEKIQGI